MNTPEEPTPTPTFALVQINKNLSFMYPHNSIAHRVALILILEQKIERGAQCYEEENSPRALSLQKAIAANERTSLQNDIDSISKSLGYEVMWDSFIPRFKRVLHPHYDFYTPESMINDHHEQHEQHAQ